MKYILVVLVSLVVGCLNDVEVEVQEYNVFEIDCKEFCEYKESGSYYVGPSSVTIFHSQIVKTSPEKTIYSPVGLNFIDGSGFIISCPHDDNKYRIYWTNN